MDKGDDFRKAFDFLYDLAIKGIRAPKVSKSVEELADEYTQRYGATEKAAQILIRNQIIKCGTSGFLAGLGGIFEMVITLPPNITSVLYVQLRMVACIATIAGYDPKDDTIQTFVYSCLAGSACMDILKQAGVKISEKIGINIAKKIPGEILIKINQRVGFRLITKFGEKGVINIGKMIPLLGGVVSGATDAIDTKIIGKVAIELFLTENGHGFSIDSD